MPRSPAKSPGKTSGPEKVFLFNCPFEEKENAKKAGAKWDKSAGCWYVLSSQNLEAFNQWHPNERKYLVCSYDEKDDAKRLGAKWDAVCKQWYIDPQQDDSSFARWLPSSAEKKTSKTGKAANDKKTKTKTTKASTQSQIATIPRINDDMTVAQLQAECRARDPSIRGLTTKKKEWFLEHLTVGTVWISAEKPPAENHDEPPPRKTTATKPKPTTSASKSGTTTTTTTKKTTKPVSKINADMTIAQLQLECRARDPAIKGISNKNKTWLLDHLKIGSKWKSQGWTEEDLPSSDSVNGKATQVQSKQQNTSKQKKDDSSSAAASKKTVSKKPAKESSMNNTTNKVKKEPASNKKASPISLKPQPKKRPIKKETEETTVSNAQSEPATKKQKVKNEESKPDAPVSCGSSKLKPRPAPRPKPTTTTAQAKTTADPPPEAASYTRINSKMSTAKLKEEARVRQLNPKTIPKLKAELVNHLVEGSICVHESAEYIAYQNLLQRVQNEHHMLLQASFENMRAAQARRQELEEQRYEKERQRLDKERQEKKEKRNLEIARQKPLHKHSFPRVHRCPMAKREDLTIHGEERLGQCNICNRDHSKFQFMFSSYATNILYSCERCDFDICNRCFEKENKSEEEKEKIRRARERAREEQRRREAEEARIEEEERSRRWDANQRFNPTIIEAKGKHRVYSSGLQFTVWCSDGYDCDGWHSYEGEPTKEFDSVWNTKEEANLRAEYLFYWKNPWGMKPEELLDNRYGLGCADDEITPRVVDGLSSYTICPPDSSRWTVGVVPTVAFTHLSESSTHRHNYDR